MLQHSLNMNLCVSVLMLLLAASQAVPVPDTEEESGSGSGDGVPEEIQTEDISTSILISNKNLSKFLMEGDIQVPKTRNAMRCWYNSCLWPKGSDGKVSIAYTVSSEFGGHERQMITNALSEIQSKTCIRFVARQRQRDFISVENRAGCFSSLGKQGGKQVISLHRRGCVFKGVIQHEFNHALGFKHEQTRSDRDRYVRINWANMDLSMGYNFYRSNTNNLNTPYDYDSVMHYGRTAFSRNGWETITPLTRTRVNIGQRQGLSYWDIRRINLLYRC